MSEANLPASEVAFKEDVSENEIDIMELAYRLLDNIKYILAVAIVGAIVAAAITSFLISPRYTATSKLYVLSVKDSAINLSDLQIGNYLASDYEEVFKNRIVHERVIANLGLGYSVDAVSRMVKVTNPSDTRILYITATSGIPEEAMNLANEYAKVAREFIAATMDTEQPNMFEDAVLPARPSAPSMRNNIIIGFLLGFLGACAVIVVQFLLDDKIRMTSDIEDYINIPVLGQLPDSGGAQGKASKKSSKHSARQSRRSRRRSR